MMNLLHLEIENENENEKLHEVWDNDEHDDEMEMVEVDIEELDHIVREYNTIHH